MQKNLLITTSLIAYQDTTLNALLKYKDHPSICVIKRVSQLFSSFYFSPVDKNTANKEIRKFKSNKAVQKTDIPVKILKENAEFLRNIFIFNITKQQDHQIFLILLSLQT